MQLELFTVVESKSDEDVQCRNCKKFLPLISFRHRSDRLNNYRVKSCKVCERKESTILKDLHYTSPNKTEHCDCCGESFGSKDLNLDHCHDTLLFRGWLCGKCNSGISLLGDNLEGIKRALKYLNNKDTEHGSKKKIQSVSL
mgnify:FL=1